MRGRGETLPQATATYLNEAPHVHVDRDDLSAKFWLDPVGLARNLGFSSSELHRIEHILAEHQYPLMEAWNEFFGYQAR